MGEARMTTGDGRGEVSIGHNMGGVFVLFMDGGDNGPCLSWHMSPEEEARRLAAALICESLKICDDRNCIEATAMVEGPGPRHGDGRLARHHA